MRKWDLWMRIWLTKGGGNTQLSARHILLLWCTLSWYFCGADWWSATKDQMDCNNIEAIIFCSHINYVGLYLQKNARLPSLLCCGLLRVIHLLLLFSLARFFFYFSFEVVAYLILLWQGSRLIVDDDVSIHCNRCIFICLAGRPPKTGR